MSDYAIGLVTGFIIVNLILSLFGRSERHG